MMILTVICLLNEMLHDERNLTVILRNWVDNACKVLI